MAELATSGIGDRDRSFSHSSDRSTEGALYNTTFDKLEVPSQAPDSGTFRVHGTVRMDRGGPLVSVPVRVVINSSYLDSAITTDLGDMNHQNTEQFAVEVPIMAPAGSVMDLTIKLQHKPPLQSYRTPVTEQHNVSIMSEGEYKTANMMGYVPWMIGGAGTGYLIDSVQGGAETQKYVLGGAAAGTAGRAVIGEQGLPSLPSFPTMELAVIAGVLFAGTMALNSARSASPISMPNISLPGGFGERESIRIPSRSS